MIYCEDYEELDQTIKLNFNKFKELSIDFYAFAQYKESYIHQVFL